MLFLMVRGSKPIPDVEFACGSASTSSVLYSRTAKLAARFMEDVVFPTPPFWLAKAIILLIRMFQFFYRCRFIPTRNESRNFYLRKGKYRAKDTYFNYTEI